MATGLSEFALRFLTDENLARQMLTAPVLIWEAANAPASEEVVLETRAGQAIRRPRSGEPVVFEVKKGTNKANAFAMGVTVGRTETNDIAVDDESVSRFHAWLAEDAKGWKLTDAESKNGTFIGGAKLEPSKSTPLPDGAKVRFGDVEMQFLLPDSFADLVRKKVAAAK